MKKNTLRITALVIWLLITAVPVLTAQDTQNDSPTTMTDHNREDDDSGKWGLLGLAGLLGLLPKKRRVDERVHDRPASSMR